MSPFLWQVHHFGILTENEMPSYVLSLRDFIINEIVLSEELCDIYYNDDNLITLNEGFETKSGVIFTSEIDDFICPYVTD